MPVVKTRRLAEGVFIVPDDKITFVYRADNEDLQSVVVDGANFDFFPTASNPQSPADVRTDLGKVKAFRQARRPREGTIARGVIVEGEYDIPGGPGGLSVKGVERRQITIFLPPTDIPALSNLTFPGRVYLFQQGLTATGALPDGVQRITDGTDVIGLSLPTTWKVTGFEPESNS